VTGVLKWEVKLLNYYYNSYLVYSIWVSSSLPTAFSIFITSTTLNYLLNMLRNSLNPLLNLALRELFLAFSPVLL